MSKFQNVPAIARSVAIALIATPFLSLAFWVLGAAAVLATALAFVGAFSDLVRTWADAVIDFLTDVCSATGELFGKATRASGEFVDEVVDIVASVIKFVRDLVAPIGRLFRR